MLTKIQEALNTPWKIGNELNRLLVYPLARLRFMASGIPWGRGWRLYGLPLVLKHGGSVMRFGDGFSLRSRLASNPLGPAHPSILCTWQEGAVLEIGDHFGMTGGTICAAERVSIGRHVIVGANSTIIDTDFHPLDAGLRRARPQDAQTAAVIIEDDVFIGMDCLILKGVRLGRGCVVGAGSVVTKDVPAGAIAAGNPARVIGLVELACLNSN